VRVRGEVGGVAALIPLIAKRSAPPAAGVNVQPETTSLSGPRTDDPHGNGSQRGVRVRIGKLSDGSYGVERWLADGTRQVPSWVDA
jgi:hypothetical protein